MSKSSRRPVPNPSEPDIAAEELRELVREAHAAIRDLTRLLREATQTLPATAQQIVDKAMEERVNAEIVKLSDHIQSESERATRKVESEIVKARDWIMHNLELIAITETPDGLRAEFNHKEWPT